MFSLVIYAFIAIIFGLQRSERNINVYILGSVLSISYKILNRFLTVAFIIGQSVTYSESLQFLLIYKFPDDASSVECYKVLTDALH